MISKPTKLGESTEITISLKTLLSVIAALVVGAYYVFNTQSKITSLEKEIKDLRSDYENYRKNPSRSQTQLNLLEKDFDYLQKQVDKLDKKIK
jgi:peptidoglycan hydrolase CwlO-like protein